MKRVIMGIIFLTIFQLAGISQKNKIVFPFSEKNISVSSFDQLTIDGNFKLTLVENDEPAIQIKGNRRFVKALKVYQHQDVLVIKNHCFSENTNNEVTINVKNLKKLIVQGQSVIITKGILQSDNLNILIDAECFIKIANNGIIKVVASESFNFETVEENQYAYKNIY